MALIRAHANAGEFAAAITCAERYQKLARRELGVTAVPEVQRLEAELRERIGREGAIAKFPGASVATALPINGVGHSETPEAAAPANVVATTNRLFYSTVVALAVAVGLIVISMLRVDRPAPVARPRQIVGASFVSLKHTTHNVAAYELYQRGQDPTLLRNDSAALEGVRLFNQAITIDPKFAAAHAGLASMYMRLTMSRKPVLPQSELRRRAMAEAAKAVALDDSLAEGHAALGLANAHWPVNLQLAERELKRAVALDSTVPHLNEYLALTHVFLGRRDEGLKEAYRAVAIDPLSPTARATVAGVLYTLDRCNEALPMLDSLDAVKPPLLRVAITRAACYASQQRWAEAIRSVEKQAARGDNRAMGLYGMSLARSGKRNEAIAVRSKLRELARINSAAYFDVMTVSMGLGDLDDVRVELKKAVDDGSIPYEVMGPVYSGLRSDDRMGAAIASRGIAVANLRIAEGLRH
jgi:tetratricopeptide (TPR) repeat protein